MDPKITALKNDGVFIGGFWVTKRKIEMQRIAYEVIRNTLALVLSTSEFILVEEPVYEIGGWK